MNYYINDLFFKLLNNIIICIMTKCLYYYDNMT